MATTPDDIYEVIGSDSNDWVAAVNLLAASVQKALDTRAEYNYRWADAIERGAEAGMREGDSGYQEDNKVEYRRISGVWKAWASDWITYFPALTNISLGTGGTNVSSYRYVNGMVEQRVRFTFGTGGTFGTQPGFSLAVTAVTPPHVTWGYQGESTYFDISASTLFYGGIISPNPNSGTAVSFATKFASGAGAASTIQPAYPAGSVPFAIAAGDIFAAHFTFQPA